MSEEVSAISNKNQQMRGRICLLGAAMLWGLAGVCVKSISWGPFSINAARSLVSFILLLIVHRTIKMRFTKINVFGAIMTTATAVLYMAANKYTSAGTAIILQYMAPIYIFLYSVIFRHRKAKWYELLITLAVFGGCVLSFADQIDATHLFGNILAALSGLTFAAELIITNDSRADAGDVVMMSNLLGVLVGIPFLFIEKGVTFTGQNMIWLAILGIFQYALPNILYSRGIQKVESVEGSLLLMMEPICNPILVALIIGEKMGTLALCGAIIVIVGIALYTLIPVIVAKKEKQKESAEA